MLALQVWIDVIVLSNVTHSMAAGIIWAEGMWSILFYFIEGASLQWNQPFFLWIIFFKTMMKEVLGSLSKQLAIMLKIRLMV